jgi:hypothetical protein
MLLLLFLTYSIIQAGIGPKMVIEDQVFNFGEIWEGQIIEQPFKVRNTGDQPLEIKRINPG